LAGLGVDRALWRPKICFVKEGFKLPAKAGYGRTVLNIQLIQVKGIPNDENSYRKNARPETCVDTGTNKLEPGERKVRDGT